MEENENNENHNDFMPKDNGENQNTPKEENSTPKPSSEFEMPEKPSVAPSFGSPKLDLTPLNTAVGKIRTEVKKFLIGQEDMIDLILVGILSNGHLLLEGVPGIAKTLTSKLVAKTLSVDFTRIQFTPDLMPSDVIGTSVYNMKTSEFKFHKGPIFSNLVLIDEINRAPAKTQAALFEVMEERQITFEGTTHKLAFPFLVVATQNPVEQEGTYRLPEAQLDRFLFKIKLHYPSLSEETMILQRFKQDTSADLSSLVGIVKGADLEKFQEVINKVKIEDSILNYIAQITHETRNHGKLYLGASPRASLAMLKASKALASMRNRDFVTPDDVQFLTKHVLNHRIILSPEAEMEGLTSEMVIDEIIHKIEVPR